MWIRVDLSGFWKMGHKIPGSQVPVILFCLPILIVS